MAIMNANPNAYIYVFFPSAVTQTCYLGLLYLLNMIIKSDSDARSLTYFDELHRPHSRGLDTTGYTTSRHGQQRALLLWSRHVGRQLFGSSTCTGTRPREWQDGAWALFLLPLPRPLAKTKQAAGFEAAAAALVALPNSEIADSWSSLAIGRRSSVIRRRTYPWRSSRAEPKP